MLESSRKWFIHKENFGFVQHGDGNREAALHAAWRHVPEDFVCAVEQSASVRRTTSILSRAFLAPGRHRADE